jgi:4-diphosphocytidyl-2-C-methyl-D-erythritol kinase
MATARVETAPAKVNLTLRVLGRRADGYHDLESLVVFAGVGDRLALVPGRALSLTVRGPTAAAAGELDNNLVLKAARALAERVAGLRIGRFELSKRLPVAAGLGGGSSDAAAALRLLARANRITFDDPRLMDAARGTGADVPVCLDPRPRIMCGIGDILSDPLDLPRLSAVLINPGVAVPTKDVFAALKLKTSATSIALSTPSPLVGEGWGGGWLSEATILRQGRTPTPNPSPQGGGERTALLAALVADRNDLEAPAVGLQPVIGDVLSGLRQLSGCRLARMSGSGATCFGLFDSSRAAAAAARALREGHPSWWVRATPLGSRVAT